ncbi:potassium channel family protein [Chengkuizengella marina]|uniref:Two pore domain potassium channel family protein n=1 Tax=Chengkuizengella marina TaxID=2507566 RepID=A0A6N9Q2E3_9BACL|nr:potassium channel family protein [Chengkuizengella marina]NBI28348.1 two pore domain potassium channel family protein [Chengkuizengella marina]
MKKLSVIYEISLFILAVTSVSLAFVSENKTLLLVDWIVWGIFFIDVSIRFYTSEKKWKYIKKNPFDIIAIIPFDAIFQLARIVRLFRVVRAIAILSRLLRPSIREILEINGLNKVIASVFALIFIASIPIYFVEPSVESYDDAIWYSIVTATTVGYGDFYPETPWGRMIAVVLMVFGIGLIGMVTGSVATYFMDGNKKENPKVDYLKKELDRLDELTNEEIDTMIDMLHKLKNKDKSENGIIP